MNKEVLKAKQAAVEEVSEKMKNTQAVLVVEYRGLTVAQLTTLRRNLRETKAEMTVYKNSIIERASEKNGTAELGQVLVGPNAYVFTQDAIASAKILVRAAKRKEHIIVKGGVVDGRVMNAEQIKVLSTLPGREGLISMFLSCLQAPIRKFACAIQAVADSKN